MKQAKKKQKSISIDSSQAKVHIISYYLTIDKLVEPIQENGTFKNLN